MPVAAWVPSRDTAGNGTTTLTDLIGSNDGTLTDMDAATDWVADTGEGGVRALDFDATNDQVICGAVGLPAGTTARTVSYWQYQRTLTSGRINAAIELRGASGRTFTVSPLQIGASYFMWTDSVSHNIVATLAQMPALLTWEFIAITYSGTELKYYKNGVLQNTLAYTGVTATITQCIIGRRTQNFVGTFDGRIDDVRIWDQVLDASDLAALDAAGRGGQA